MVSQGRGRLFRRKDGKYLVYLPLDLCEDSQFPFRDMLKSNPSGQTSMPVNVSFSTDKKGPIALLITPMK